MCLLADPNAEDIAACVVQAILNPITTEEAFQHYNIVCVHVAFLLKCTKRETFFAYYYLFTLLNAVMLNVFVG
eukprot:m.35390 g.35390  ORF g.35390 m.35390 type:complete len:73 (+) comp10011_c0_seq6:1301-1519(+)